MKKTKKPWGSFIDLYHDDNTHIKIIKVKEGKRLSLQSHENRREEWKVLKGKIIVTSGWKVSGQLPSKLDQKIYTEGEFCFIGKGMIHRMQSFEGDAEVLEIASGEFNEEDIVRYEDDYGRQGTTKL